MALSITNNISSLNAQNNLSRTSSALSRSLERLSTGLKINRGADGPAGLVISEQQRAQIAGLKTAIDNTNKAVSLVQTAEGALNELNTPLTKVRSLALDALKQVTALVERKAGGDADGFKRWVAGLSTKVAEAAKEGGFLGIGGTAVSDAERAALSDISSTLGLA